jgi:hypothetical protein
MTGNKKLIGVLVASLLLAAGSLPVMMQAREERETSEPFEEVSVTVDGGEDSQVILEDIAEAEVTALVEQNPVYHYDPDEVEDMLEDYWYEARSYYRSLNPELPYDISNVICRFPDERPFLFTAAPIHTHERNKLVALLIFPVTEQFTFSMHIVLEYAIATGDRIDLQFTVMSQLSQTPRALYSKDSNTITLYHDGYQPEALSGGWNEIDMYKSALGTNVYSRSLTDDQQQPYILGLLIAAAIGAVVGGGIYSAHAALSDEEDWNVKDFGIAMGAGAVCGFAGQWAAGAIGAYLGASGAVGLTTTQQLLQGIGSGLAGGIAGELFRWALDDDAPEWVKEHAPQYWFQGGDALYLFIRVPDDRKIYAFKLIYLPQ